MLIWEHTQWDWLLCGEGIYAAICGESKYFFWAFIFKAVFHIIKTLLNSVFGFPMFPCLENDSLALNLNSLQTSCGHLAAVLIWDPNILRSPLFNTRLDWYLVQAWTNGTSALVLGCMCLWIRDYQPFGVANTGYLHHHGEWMWVVFPKQSPLLLCLVGGEKDLLWWWELKTTAWGWCGQKLHVPSMWCSLSGARFTSTLTRGIAYSDDALSLWQDKGGRARMWIAWGGICCLQRWMRSVGLVLFWKDILILLD